MDRKFWVLLLGVLLLFSLYLPLNRPFGEIFDFKTSIDDLIPLWTPFIIIYLSYFGFLILALIYLIKRREYKSLKIGLLAIILSCSVAYIFYYFFQNKIERPVIENRNFFDGLYIHLNAGVAQYNALPSLHVAISTIIGIVFYKSRSKYFRPVLIWIVLIIASTVLTKQHYFLDVLAGLILGMFSYLIANNSGKFARITLHLRNSFRL